MKLLANENIPLATIRRLRTQGHDVASIVEMAAGSTDEQVLRQAHDEDRVLFTFDRDYGELIYVRGLPCPSGLIYLRFIPSTPEEPAERLARLFAEMSDGLIGGFVVVDRDGYRRRPLPKA
ncbi:putative nuclease of predicted toxin-antitoxin system [Sulfuritortus calidifontis]|uniref:Putative nuclease of predicted toxin-antitoxin system n=1 Tax=Sulfuritortus calidifontis TaxID=1914471 RepID=A0A4R3JSF4_9PROT|nr:DUF5615 family PIN-like protein [Sulfuritortus calidifontis]TCS69000.1 putative nuclease of predicted toxin-antitoxin system [Sulfuritortus calidifontis]